jgi:crossover junction endodeoxyribonuclease RuvC
MARALGLDPGIRGGLAVVDSERGLLAAIDIPTIGVGASERVDVLAVAEWIRAQQPDLAFVERAQAMPKQGASSGFKYGRATGSLEAAIILALVSFEVVEPPAWKKAFRLRGKEKEAARQRALELFPAAHALLARKRDHGRAEAALIALFGLKGFRREAEREPEPILAEAVVEVCNER